jgi:hypothetical protein
MEALWLSNGIVVASLLHTRRNVETGMSLLLCRPDASPSRTLLETDKWVLQLVDSWKDSLFFVTGIRHHFPPSEFRIGSAPPKQIGTWSIRVGDRAEARCLANAGPFGGSLGVVDDRCVFADASQQTSTSSVLIAASPNHVRAASIPGFLRNFALWRRNLLFGSFGNRFGIYSVALERLLD